MLVRRRKPINSEINKEYENIKKLRINIKIKTSETTEKTNKEWGKFTCIRIIKCKIVI